jgi:hypothetical protein
MFKASKTGSQIAKIMHEAIAARTACLTCYVHSARIVFACTCDPALEHAMYVRALTPFDVQAV